MRKSIPKNQMKVHSMFLLFMAVFITIPAFSATYYSRQSGNWNVANTWSLVGFGGAAAANIPGAGDDVVIDLSSITLDAANVTVASVLVLNSNGWSGVPAALFIENGRKLTVTGNMEVRTENVDKKLTVELSGNNTQLEIFGDLIFTREANNFRNKSNNFILNDNAIVTVHGDYSVDNLGSGPHLFQLEIELKDQSTLICKSDVNWVFNDQGYHGVFAEDNSSWQIEGELNVTHNGGDDIWFYSVDQADINILQDFNLNITGQGGFQLGANNNSIFQMGGDFSFTHPSGEAFTLTTTGQAQFNVGGNFDFNWTGSSAGSKSAAFRVWGFSQLNIAKSFTVNVTEPNWGGLGISIKDLASINVGQNNGLLEESATINLHDGYSLSLELSSDAHFNVYGDLSSSFNGFGHYKVILGEGVNTATGSSSLNVLGNLSFTKSGGRSFVLKSIINSSIFVGGNLMYTSTNHEMGNLDEEEIIVSGTAEIEVGGNFTFALDDPEQAVTMQVDISDNGELKTGSLPNHITSLSLINGKGINVSISNQGVWETSGNFNINCINGSNTTLVETNNTAKLVVGNNLVLNNTQNTHELRVQSQLNSQIEIGGNVDMINIIDQNRGILSALSNSKLELGGNFIQNPAPNNYGKIQVLHNAVMELNGSNAQSIPPSSGAGTDFTELGNVVLNSFSINVPQFTVPEDASMKSLTVNSLNEIEISSDVSLTVTDAISNNGSIYVENNASLVQTHAGANANGGTGSYFVNRTGKNVPTVYNVWSSPINNASLVSAFNGTNACDMFVFVPGSQSWSYDFAAGFSTTCGGNAVTFQAGNVIAGGDGIMDIARGYYVPGSANATRTFTGEVNNGNIQVAIETTALGNNANWTDDDWNLVGNPYPSSLNASAFWTENAVNNARITDGIYYWDDVDPNAAANQNTDYAYWNMAGGVSSGNSNKIPNGHIASGQGFWVYANANSNLVFNNSMRSTTNDQFFKQESENVNHNVWLSLSTPSQKENNILVGFNAKASDEVDDLFDAHKLEVNPHVYFASRVDSQNFVIQSLAILTMGDAKKVPLTLKSDEYGMHTIKAYKKENLSDNIKIYIHDKFQGTMHDLAQGDFVIGLNPNQEYTARFELVFQYELKANEDVIIAKGLPADSTHVSNIEDVENNGVSVLVTSDHLQVLNENGINGLVQVFDLTGKIVFEKNAGNEDVVQVSNWSSLAQGTYVVSVVSNKEVAFTQQVYKK